MERKVLDFGHVSETCVHWSSAGNSIGRHCTIISYNISFGVQQLVPVRPRPDNTLRQAQQARASTVDSGSAQSQRSSQTAHIGSGTRARS